MKANQKGILIPLAVVTVIGIGWLVFSATTADTKSPAPGSSLSAKVERIRNGHSVKLDDGRNLKYAGIRAPYQEEPLFEQSMKRNRELVEGRKVRMRFESREVQQGEKLRAYVFAGGEFVNEILVREGLAYVRLTTNESRFATELLEAQKEARQHRRGIWKRGPKTREPSYPADAKYGNFHRPTCEESNKIRPNRLQKFRTSREAVVAGFAPCNKCRPRT